MFVATEPTDYRPSTKSHVVMYGLVALWVTADQLTKLWAETQLTLGVYVPVIGDYLGWRLVYNPGAAFGIAANFTWVLAIIAAVAVIGIGWFSTRVTHPLWLVGTSALLGGAVSHLGDRLFREPGFALGHIVDFIDYAGFFVGNVADIALVGGAAVLILASFLAPPSPESADDDEEDKPSTVDAVDELSDLPWEKKEKK
jgi:signal peptidase II